MHPRSERSNSAGFTFGAKFLKPFDCDTLHPEHMRLQFQIMLQMINLIFLELEEYSKTVSKNTILFVFSSDNRRLSLERKIIKAISKYVYRTENIFERIDFCYKK